MALLGEGIGPWEVLTRWAGGFITLRSSAAKTVRAGGQPWVDRDDVGLCQEFALADIPGSGRRGGLIGEVLAPGNDVPLPRRV